MGWAQQPTLEQQARTVGLLGAAVADLTPVKYEPRDERYGQTLQAVMGIFQSDSPVPIDQAIAAAEALGQAGDPRLAKHHRAENWVAIPAGEFWMGAQAKNKSKPNYDPEASDDEAPVHKVHLSAYCIGRYPVTVAEYLEFIGHDGYEEEKYWHGGRLWPVHRARTMGRAATLSEPPGGRRQLVRGFRLRRLGQVPLADRSRVGTGRPRGDDRKYPWGNEEPDPTRMNYATETKDGWKPNVGHPTPVGVYPRGLSPEGIADMAGNVWEWCADWYAKYTGKGGQDPNGPTRRTWAAWFGAGLGTTDPRVCRVSYRSDFPSLGPYRTLVSGWCACCSARTQSENLRSPASC